MNAETCSRRGGLIERIVVAIGRRRTPAGVAGHLVISLPSGRKFEIGEPSQGGSAELNLKSYQLIWASVRRGSVGFCESYVDDHWDSPDPARVIAFYLKNREVLDRAGKRLFFKSVLDRILHLLRNNSRTGSRRNIEAHYDIGNDFYRLWLDQTMTYSSAWFGDGAHSLEDAQMAKYRLVLDAAKLSPGDQLLEIGFGWGGFAKYATSQGARVTGITLSQEQLSYAAVRLDGSTDLRVQDYREVDGVFDRIVSIEMIEAVGEAHWPRYFRTLADRLKPGGIAAVQAITIDDRWFSDYRKSADFIQRHIFPGGMLPTVEILRQQAEAVGLDFEPVQRFGQDYARTLSIWRQNFESAWPRIAALGFDERFRRKWRLYLAYCEAGFRERAIDVGVYRLIKP